MRRTALTLLLACVLAAQAAAGQPESPRLSALKSGLESGRGEAIEEFWREVAREGAPLVEPAAGDAENLLVTFLRRDGAAEKYVAVFPLARVNPLPHLFTRMGGTDLWFKTYRLRRDARFEYLVSAQTLWRRSPPGSRPRRAAGWPACAPTRSTRAVSSNLPTRSRPATAGASALTWNCPARRRSPTSASAREWRRGAWSCCAVGET